MSKRITDTTKLHPLVYLMAAMSEQHPGAEACGQTELVQSTQLPRKMDPDNCRVYLESLGFTFTEGTDALFIDATMPAGWTKRATDHAMWTDLLDPQGHVRACIFYKAASYHREAFMMLMCRYNCVRAKRDGVYVCQITDCGVVIHETEPIAADTARAAARAWLAEHYPQHDDPTAYWEAE